MSFLFWSAVFGYPLLQLWALWQSRGRWRKLAWGILLTAGTAYGWCCWALFLRPRFAVHPGKLDALFEFMGITFVGPAVLLILTVVIVFAQRSRTRLAP